MRMHRANVTISFMILPGWRSRMVVFSLSEDPNEKYYQRYNPKEWHAILKTSHPGFLYGQMIFEGGILIIYSGRFGLADKMCMKKW